MSKKVWFGLLGLFCLGLIVVPMFGCSVTATVKKDPGLLTTEKAVISGSASYSGGTVTVGLGAVMVSGEAVTMEARKIAVYVGKAGTATAEWTGVDITLPGADTAKPIDLCFILDNTGSMGGAITGSKNSIVAFATSLEAAGIDAKFGLATFGDSPKHPTPPGQITDEGTPSYTDGYYTREVAALGTASALQGVLATVQADSGGDAAENPLDAIKWANANLSWRTGAQKIFIVITDVYAHQITDTTGTSSSGGNRCTTSAEAIIGALRGNAVIHVVSPDYSYAVSSGLLDCRRLADGLGEGRATPESSTGGKWIEFSSSGFDLNALGISTILTRSTTVRFSYTFDAGTWYIHLLVDSDGDGVMDSDVVITVTVTASGAIVPVASSVTKLPYVSPSN
jgi:hypothetical protein